MSKPLTQYLAVYDRCFAAITPPGWDHAAYLASAAELDRLWAELGPDRPWCTSPCQVYAALHAAALYEELISSPRRT